MNDRAGISRREFMARMSMLSSLALVYPVDVLAELRNSKQALAPDATLAEWQQQPVWQTISQVQEILFPAAEDIPGAGDIAATVYLHDAIENPDADIEDKNFIVRGVGWLDDLTQDHHKKTFLQLTSSEQQKIIEIIVNSRAGRNWISTLLTYTLEALLTDPIYGGNKNAAGWQWLGYQPGYPRPPSDKTWHHLLRRRYKS